MKELTLLGQTIKQKRLSLNLRMDDVAKKVGITRATLWAIEKGDGKCSISSVLKVMDVLNIPFSFEDQTKAKTKRDRAQRINSYQDKNINRFIIMCVEQYAGSVKKDSGSIYRAMKENGVIDDLKNDYEDLHGMSTVYLNDYIGSLLKDMPYNALSSDIENHQLAKSLLIVKVSELIAQKYRILIDEARDKLYSSDLINLIDDSETGLYGESPLYVFSLFEEISKKTNKK